MKKILIMTLNMSLISLAYAMDPVRPPFYTIELAQQYCPLPDNLFFSPMTQSVGTIRGSNRFEFESISQEGVIYPKNMDSSGLIKDAQFRKESGFYGYINDQVITCFYSYNTIDNAEYPLVMRGGYLVP